MTTRTSEPTPTPVEVKHFFPTNGIKGCSCLTEFLRRLGIEVPVNMNPERSGVGGLDGMTLVHGPQRLAVVQMGISGRGLNFIDLSGPRVHCLGLSGAHLMAEITPDASTAIRNRLVLVTSDDWCCRWATIISMPYTGRQLRSVYGVADRTGQHVLDLSLRGRADAVSSRGWAGQDHLPMAERQIMALFDRRLPENASLRGLDLMPKTGSRAAA